MSGSTAVVSLPADDPSTLVPAANVAPALPPAAYDDEDPDDRELREAREAVARQKAGAPDPAPAGNTAPAAVPSAPAATPPVSVPYARFAELLKRTKAAEDAAIYHRGRAEALAQAGAAPASQPTAAAADEVSPAWEEATAIHNEWIAAAKEYDAGAITAEEFEGQKLPLLARTLSLHFGAFREEVRAMLQDVQAAPGIVDQTVMNEQLRKLEEQHPWSTHATDGEMAALVRMAHTEAEALGKPYARGPDGTMRLRARVAALATQFIPAWRGGTTTAPPSAAPPPAAAPTAPPATRPNPADVTAALQRQSNHPPNRPGSHGVTGPLTLDRVDTMSDDELENMSPAERRRLLGVVVS